MLTISLLRALIRWNLTLFRSVSGARASRPRAAGTAALAPATVTAAVLVAAIAFAPLSVAQGRSPEPVRYDGHKLIRAWPQNVAEVETILTLTPDLWSHDIAAGRPADFRLPPDLMDEMRETGIRFEIVQDNLQNQIEREYRERNQLGGTWFEAYKSYAEHMAYLDTLAAVNPDITETFFVGNSIEGRAIRGIRIVGNGSNQPAYVIQGCQHAREWVSPMVCQFIADHLVRNYGSDAEVTRLVDSIEFIIVPMVNPDGYEWSWNVDRFWRKNRRNNGDGTRGVDLNRNWGVGWGGEGSSGNTGSDVYRGTGPFSEPETAVMRDFMLSLPNVVVHFDMHSYSQLLLAPWGYQPGLPEDHDLFQELGGQMQQRIFQVHGENYIHGPAYHTLYPAAGIAPDWGYGTLDAIGFTFELRDQGQNGFVLPADQIIPNGEEIVPAILYVADFVSRVIEFDFPDGLPVRIDPDVTTPVVVEISGAGDSSVDPDSATLYWRTGGSGPFDPSPMTDLGNNRYEAILPATPCGETVDFYFYAETTSGEGQTSPPSAPAETYHARAVNFDVILSDDFETDIGFTVQNVDLTDGAWSRGIPIGGGDRGDPPSDFDGSGRCWVTDNVDGDSDVDGGPTRLISPNFDLSASPDAQISYARWFSNDDNDGDRLTVHVSNNGGSSWTLVESVGNTHGWSIHTFRVADFLTPTSQVRIRFSATDNPNDSVTEAGIDALEIFVESCGPSTELTGFSIVNGALLDGDLSDLVESDDSAVHTRSGFGRTVVDLHNMEMLVNARTSVPSPVSLDLAIESRIDEPSGTMRVGVRNWTTGEIDLVGTFPIGQTDRVHRVEGLDGARYVDSDGEIEVFVKHIVFVPFLAFTFESFVDQVEAGVN